MVTCHVCGEVAKYRGLKLCARCYQRQKANGDFELHARQRQQCIIVGCQEWVKAYGYCVKHWRRVEKHGDHEDRKWSRRGSDRCVVPGCGRRHRSMGLCDAHYGAEQRRGHPLWRTLGRRKVHNDRPWTPDTVRDLDRLVAAEQARPSALTPARCSQQTPEPGDPMTETSDPQTCPTCQQEVVPEVCGELEGGVACMDLLCPICGEDLPVSGG